LRSRWSRRSPWRPGCGGSGDRAAQPGGGR
jgi:hypothetical protein